MSDKKKPARWRKARNPNKGGRWSTPMNNHIWFRDHGHDIELHRESTHLATIRPVAGRAGLWEYRAEIGGHMGWETAGDQAAAKRLAKAEAVRRESES